VPPTSVFKIVATGKRKERKGSQKLRNAREPCRQGEHLGLKLFGQTGWVGAEEGKKQKEYQLNRTAAQLGAPPFNRDQ